MPVLVYHSERFQMFVTTYTRLTGHTGRDDDDLSTLKSLLQTIIGWEVACDLCGSRDMREISCNSGGVHNIVESELCEGALRRSEMYDGTYQWPLTSVTSGLALRSKESGWPIPPGIPHDLRYYRYSRMLNRGNTYLQHQERRL
jgi:hypothetical protein